MIMFQVKTQQLSGLWWQNWWV